MIGQTPYRKPTKRNVWAGDTAEQLKLAYAERKKINDKIVEIQSCCNHTFADGVTAFDDHYDHDDGHYLVCSACNTRTS